MGFKLIYKIFLVGLAFLFLFSVSIQAQETEEYDAEFNERIELIQASQRISEEKRNASIFRNGISLYVTNFHTDETEYKLGGKFEHLISDTGSSKETNDIFLSYVIEGIYLEGEATNLAGFLSLKAALNNRMFSPYFGLGAEFMGVANYQGFVGLNIFDQNVFVETKFINKKDEWDSGDFYSVVGFTIDL